MEIDTPLVMKQMSEVAVGELLLVDYKGEWCLAVCLRRDADSSDVLIGLLDGDDIGWPHTIELRTHHHCGSYGIEWYLELVASEETVPYGGAKHRENYGAIFIGTDGVAALTFGPAPNARGDRGGGFKLPAFSRTSFDNDSIPYLRWKIWRNRKCFEGQTSGALIREIVAKAPPPR